MTLDVTGVLFCRSSDNDQQPVLHMNVGRDPCFVLPFLRQWLTACLAHERWPWLVFCFAVPQRVSRASERSSRWAAAARCRSRSPRPTSSNSPPPSAVPPAARSPVCSSGWPTVTSVSISTSRSVFIDLKVTHSNQENNKCPIASETSSNAHKVFAVKISMTESLCQSDDLDLHSRSQLSQTWQIYIL